jgi:hypothetical protein
VQRIWQEFLPKFRPWWNSNQEKSSNKTHQQGLWLHWHVDGHVSSAFGFLPAALWNEWCTAKVVDGYGAIAGAHTHIAASSSWVNLPLLHVIGSGQIDQGAVLMAAKREEEIGGELRFLGA